MLRVESTAGLYNALGKGVSPVRFLPPDEVARLKADSEKKRGDGLAAQRKKQRAAGQPGWRRARLPQFTSRHDAAGHGHEEAARGHG